MKKEVVITGSIALAAILGLVLLIMFGSSGTGSPSVADAAYLVRSNSHMIGTTSAKVTIVEFGDYECPACGYAEPILEQVRAAYATNTAVNIVFRNYPLPQHANAMIAAEAAEAAGAQGKFWQMHDLLYTHQNDWTDSSDPESMFVSYAQTLKLNVAAFQKALDTNAYQQVIEADQADGNALGVSFTPSIYINGVLQQSIPILEQFQSMIQAALAK